MTHFRLLLILLSSGSLTAASEECSVWVDEYLCDGDDVLDDSINVLSHQECSDLCTDNSLCQAWTYQTDWNSCFLKTNAECRVRVNNECILHYILTVAVLWKRLD